MNFRSAGLRSPSMSAPPKRRPVGIFEQDISEEPCPMAHSRLLCLGRERRGEKPPSQDTKECSPLHYSIT